MGAIYALHLGDGNYRYVGKTILTAEKRLAYHLKDARRGSNLPVHNWIRKHGKNSIAFDVLYFGDSEDLLFDMEKFFIKSMRDLGYDLLNLTNGGEGTSGYKMSDSQKDFLSQLKKGKPGFPHTEEHKARMSAMFKGRGLPWVSKVIEARGDKFKGAGNPRALLSEFEVEEILYLSTLEEWPCAAAIADYYPVGKGTIERILSGKSWPHIARPSGVCAGKRVTRDRARSIIELAFEARKVCK